MDIRERIRHLTLSFAQANSGAVPFEAGRTAVPVSGRVLDGDDLAALVDSSLDGWLTAGRHTELFEQSLARYVGVRSSVFVNSGSSANLLAVSALTSRSLGTRALTPGDEVISLALSFPTTINPLLQNLLVPVLVDIEIGTYDAIAEQLVAAIGPKTKAIMMAHTLGNPFNVSLVKELCERFGLWLIEDNCDALGSTYEGERTGSFGDLATLSFYPAHHITTGEGGAVLVRSPRIRKLIESFRDWGRDCYCAPGCDNTCKKRFEWQMGDLPFGYDHKYIYTHIGYNLKATDMQAALGNSQLQKLDEFVTRRKANFNRLNEGLASVDGLILPRPTPGSSPSWFGYPITIQPESGVDRRQLLRFLDSRMIGTRLFFAGNVLRQPAFKRSQMRVVGNLSNTDTVMTHGFWIGTYPGLTDEMLDYVVESISDFMSNPRESD